MIHAWLPVNHTYQGCNFVAHGEGRALSREGDEAEETRRKEEGELEGERSIITVLLFSPFPEPKHNEFYRLLAVLAINA